MLYPETLSDREIVERSVLSNPKLFDKDDEIMADKGFEIRDLTDKLGVNLNIPIFLRSRDQFEVDEVVINQKIASTRIHVERFISRLKTYKYFDKPITNMLQFLLTFSHPLSQPEILLLTI